MASAIETGYITTRELFNHPEAGFYEPQMVAFNLNTGFVDLKRVISYKDTGEQVEWVAAERVILLYHPTRDHLAVAYVVARASRYQSLKDISHLLVGNLTVEVNAPPHIEVAAQLDKHLIGY